MDTKELVRMLDEILPNQKVQDDLWQILKETSETDISIFLDEQQIKIPLTCPITIITKAFYKEYCDIAFRTGYRVQLAIGDIIALRHGIIEPGYCFSTIYYDENIRIITADFHRAMR
jgi:hypothetical protein